MEETARTFGLAGMAGHSASHATDQERHTDPWLYSYCPQADKIVSLTNAAGAPVEPVWASLLAKALEGKDVKELLSNVGSGSGGVAAAPVAAAGGAAPAAAEEKKEEKKEEKEESDDGELKRKGDVRL